MAQNHDCSSCNTVIVDIFYRPNSRAPLERVLGAFGTISRGRLWTLVASVGQLLDRYQITGEDRANPSQDEEDRHNEPTP